MSRNISTSNIQQLSTLLPSGTAAPTNPSNRSAAPGLDDRPKTSGDHKALAASIMADGGLGFLRSRVEEKLQAVFAAKQETRPESAPAGPPPFFGSQPDSSPEATADRIVSFAMGLHSVFRRQNRDLAEPELQSRFLAEIRRGVTEGFDQARGILSDMGRLDEATQATLDQTWELIQQKLDELAPETEIEAEAD